MRWQLGRGGGAGMRDIRMKYTKMVSWCGTAMGWLETSIIIFFTCRCRPWVLLCLGHDAGYNFDFDIDLDYGSLRESEGFSFTNKEIDHSDKQYNGYHGSQNSGNKVKINSEYGSVTFKKL